MGTKSGCSWKVPDVETKGVQIVQLQTYNHTHMIAIVGPMCMHLLTPMTVPYTLKLTMPRVSVNKAGDQARAHAAAIGACFLGRGW